jgi:hypothetical protein
VSRVRVKKYRAAPGTMKNRGKKIKPPTTKTAVLGMGVSPVN